jgi:hypothetical protein
MKTALLHDIIIDKQLVILALTETWFSIDTPVSVSVMNDVAVHMRLLSLIKTASSSIA